jgi:hypothetical protein
MTNLTWDAETLAAGGQLLIAAALVGHLLVLRPRAARENLALSARVIGDDITLDQNHDLLPVEDPDVERVRQLLNRIAQDPSTAKNVLLVAEAGLTPQPDFSETGYRERTLRSDLDRIRLDANLTRLADACTRYLHDAWPLAGVAQRARHAHRPGPAHTVVLRPDDEDGFTEQREEAFVAEEAEEAEQGVQGLDDPVIEDIPSLVALDDSTRRVPRIPRQVEPDDDTAERHIIPTPLRTAIDLTEPHDEDDIVRLPTAPAGWERPRTNR